MTVGKRVGVHDDTANFFSFATLFCQRFGVTLQTRGAVFHQHHNARYAGQRREATLLKQRFVFGFGINEEMRTVTLIREIEQLSGERQG